MKKTIYKKEYITADKVNVNDVLLDIDYPFDFGDLRMTVMEKPVVDFDKMFEIVYKDAAKDDYKKEYINKLECIIRVKPYDISKYETDKDGTYYKAFQNYKGELYNKKPICRIVKLSDNG